MQRLRRILCGCFGWMALLFSIPTLVAIPVLFFRMNRYGLGRPRHPLASSAPGFAVAFWIFELLTVIAPLAMAAVSSVAWWKLKRGQNGARGWAIAASIALLLNAIPLGLAISVGLAHRPLRSLVWHLVAYVAIVLTVGIAGLIAFGRRDALQQPLSKPKPPRIAGDGTSGVLDAVAWIVALASYWTIQTLCWRWAHAHHLHGTWGFAFWAMFAAAVLLETTLHECGHAFAGLAMGMKLRLFVVGPFLWRVRDGRWMFRFEPAKFLSAGGAAGVVPTDPQQPVWHELTMIAAGPITSLLTGLAGLAALFTAKGMPWEPAWESLALLASMGLTSFVVNLIPLRPDSFYSDGAQIYQLLSGGPWADLHRVMAVVQATLVTPLRPRDYDIDGIERAKRLFPQGIQALLIRLFAISYYIDSGMLPEARAALADAEQAARALPMHVPPELAQGLVFDCAWLRRDAAGARSWWEQVEGKLKDPGVDYWLARSAVLWVEEKPEEARAAWVKGNQLAQVLPAAGAYQFDRYRYELLGAVLEGAPVAETQAVEVPEMA